jgi:hypothetical protein
MEQNKYHDLDCCENNKGVDKLFDNYRKNTNMITDLMANNPDKLMNDIWSHASLLCIDVSCQCRLGEGNRRSKYSCSQCKNIGRIKDFRNSELTFSIQCGVNEGKKMIILPYKIKKLFLQTDDKTADKASSYLLQHKNVKLPSASDRFIVGDEFTNRVLIMLMLTKIFREKKMPTILNLYTAFICGEKGYALMDEPTIGSLNNLHKITKYHNKDNILDISVSKTIIYQLITTLDELSYVKFSHGNPSVEALVFGCEKVSYKYNGLWVDGNVTLKIVDMWNSSATFSGNHYFSKNINSELYMECNVFIPQFESLKINDIQYYRLNSDNIDVFIAMNRTGIPIYIGSFDLYCFFISLMCDKSFYSSVVKDKKLSFIWESMWLSDDYQEINQLICEHHVIVDNSCNQECPINNFETTVNIILGFWLRCDIIVYLLSLLKMK